MVNIDYTLGTEFAAFQVFSFHAFGHRMHIPYRIPQQAGETCGSGSLNKWCCFGQVINGDIYSINPLDV